MSHVFVSYVHENETDVRKLRDDLLKHGVRVWLDRHDIKPGTRWQDAIRKAIRSGDFFIACFSKQYYDKSKSYMNEELQSSNYDSTPLIENGFFQSLSQNVRSPTARLAQAKHYETSSTYLGGPSKKRGSRPRQENVSSLQTFPEATPRRLSRRHWIL